MAAADASTVHLDVNPLFDKGLTIGGVAARRVEALGRGEGKGSGSGGGRGSPMAAAGSAVWREPTYVHCLF